MKLKLSCLFVLAGAIILATSPNVSAKQGNGKARVPGYLALGASYTYGYGAIGNDDGGPEKTHENPGFGYTDDVYDYLLEQNGNKKMEHLNLAIGGATSAQINEGQLAAAVEFLDTHRRTVIEIGSGGNDLLGFMLFPQNLPPALIPGHLACNQLSGSYDPDGCDDVIGAIVGQAEANLRVTLDTVIENMANHSSIVLRSFPNAIANSNTTPGHPQFLFPIDFTCEGLPSATAPTGAMYHFYGVAAFSDQIEDLLNEDSEDLEGLNVMIARVAAEYAADGYNVAFADIGSTNTNGVYWDCIHPTDAGHDAIADIMIDVIDTL